jgi:hypothetical protein
MGSTSVAGKGKGVRRGFWKQGTHNSKRGCEDGDKGLMGHGLRGGGCKVRVA